MSKNLSADTVLLENARLKRRITQLNILVAELEAKIGGASLPILDENFGGHTVKLILRAGMPLVLADSVILQLPYVPDSRRKRFPGETAAVERLRVFGMGLRDLISIPRSELTDAFRTSPRTLCHTLGVSTKSQWIGFVTPIGLDGIKQHAPKFCSWVETVAFPKVIERLGKGGAS